MPVLSAALSRHYCPLDVFSGVTATAENALETLLALWAANPHRTPKLPLRAWLRGTDTEVVDGATLRRAVPAIVAALLSSGVVAAIRGVQAASRVPIAVLGAAPADDGSYRYVEGPPGVCWGRDIANGSVPPHAPLSEPVVVVATAAEGVGHIERFYRAQSVRDCSVAITCCRGDGPVTVMVLDLDDKRRKSIPHYAAQDRALVAAYVTGNGLEGRFLSH